MKMPRASPWITVMRQLSIDHDLESAKLWIALDDTLNMAWYNEHALDARDFTDAPDNALQAGSSASARAGVEIQTLGEVASTVPNDRHGLAPDVRNHQFPAATLIDGHAGRRVDHLHDMIIAEMHTTTVLTLIGDDAHFGSAILLTNIDATKWLTQGSTGGFRTYLSADDPESYMQILLGIIAFLFDHLAQLCQKCGEGMNDGHLRQSHHLHVKIGHADTTRQHGSTQEALLHLADGARYWAKSHGRDRWHIYSTEAGDAQPGATDR
jgi:hypothetical protein